MASIGNVLPSLSTSVPLGVGGVWTSEPYQLGIWNSLSITVATDQNGILDVAYSPYGLFFDISSNYNIVGGTPIVIETNPTSAWIRLTYTNTGGAESYLRLSTYATVSANNTTVLIPDTSSINIKNIQLGGFDDLSVVQDQPEMTYYFTYVNSTAQTAASGLWYMNYPDIYAASAGTMTLQGFSQCLQVTLQSPYGFGQSYLQGRVARARAGQALRCRFTAGFYQVAASSRTGNFVSRMLVGLGYGTNPHADGGNLTDGYYFGYGKETLPVDNSSFCISYAAFGTITSTQQKNWNIDRCDGTQNMPAMNWRVMNNFQISTQMMGNGAVTFCVENPVNGIYYPVHRIITNGDAPNTQGDSLGFSVVATANPNGYPTGSAYDYINIASYGLYKEGKYGRSDLPHTTGTTVSIPYVETPIIVVQNPSTWTQYGVMNRMPLQITRFSSTTAGGTGVLFRIYLYNKLDVSAWVELDPITSPMQITANSSWVSGLRVLSIYSYGGNVEEDLNPYNLILAPYDNCVVTAQSLSSTVQGAFSLNYSFA